MMKKPQAGFARHNSPAAAEIDHSTDDFSDTDANSPTDKELVESKEQLSVSHLNDLGFDCRPAESQSHDVTDADANSHTNGEPVESKEQLSAPHMNDLGFDFRPAETQSSGCHTSPYQQMMTPTRKHPTLKGDTLAVAPSPAPPQRMRIPTCKRRYPWDVERTAINMSTCGKKRAREEEDEEPLPSYKTSRIPNFPRRDILEGDVTYAFRVLSYLETSGIIDKDQNAACRRILSQEVAHQLTATLEYAYSHDNGIVKRTIDAIVPPPKPFVEQVANAVTMTVTNEIKKNAIKGVIGTVLKAVSYVAVGVGTAVAMTLREKIVS